MVGCIKIPCMKWTSVFSCCLPLQYLSDCLWKWNLSALTWPSCAANWTTECSWKWRHHLKSSNFNFSPSPTSPKVYVACQHLHSWRVSVQHLLPCWMQRKIWASTAKKRWKLHSKVIVLRIPCVLLKRTFVYSTHLSNSIKLFLFFAVLPIYWKNLQMIK